MPYSFEHVPPPAPPPKWDDVRLWMAVVGSVFVQIGCINALGWAGWWLGCGATIAAFGFVPRDWFHRRDP